MSKGGTQSSFYPVTIEKGVILDVDPDRWCVTTGMFMTNRMGVEGLPIMSEYLGTHGEGSYVIPEIGSVCWVCYPSDTTKAFVLGFTATGDAPQPRPGASPDEESAAPVSYASNRPKGNPGDMIHLGRDGNFMILRRGGIVQIGSNKFSQRIYIPVGNIIRDLCQSYELQTVAGSLQWEVDNVNGSPDVESKTRFRLSAYLKASDRKPVVEIVGGEQGSGATSTPVLSITIRNPDSGFITSTITMSKEGDLSCTLLGTGSYTLTSNDWTVIARRNAVLSAAVALTIGAPQLAIVAGGVAAGAPPGLNGGIGMEIQQGGRLQERWRSMDFDTAAATLGPANLPEQRSVKGDLLKTWLEAITIVVDPISHVGTLSPASRATLAATLSGTVKIRG